MTQKLRRGERSAAVSAITPRDALKTEAEIFDTLELARLAEISDIGSGTIDALSETADLLCRAYPSTPAPQHPSTDAARPDQETASAGHSAARGPIDP
jgi:hypothetical protein